MIKNLFLANNDMGAADLFYFRQLYHDNVLVGLNDKRVDLWYDVPTYGRVDFKNNSVYISESNLKQLDSGNNKETLLALDFVVDAFDDLQRYFQKAVTLKRIKISGVIGKMEPKKAWISVTNLHHIHVDCLYKLFTLSYLKTINENKIEKFENFLMEFLNFAEQIKNIFPITRSSFIISRFCSPLTSGLIIEIEDKDRGDDSIKQQDILDDENYNFFKSAAKRFGFFLDKNIPFRLVADIMSKKMREYMSNYGITSENLFKNYYYRALDFDMDILKNYMIQMWNSYIHSFPYAKELKETCSGKKLLVKIIKREEYNENIVYLDDKFWLEYYFKIRVKEANLNWDEGDINKKVKNSIDLLKALDISHAIEYIDKECKRG